MAVCCIYVCLPVCFAEEVILADDENENDYDGNKSLFLFHSSVININ